MENLKNKNKRVVVAMSGGVDSSVAALLLKKKGYSLIGVFMRFWTEPKGKELIKGENRCCSPESEIRARQVAKILKIPFYVFNFEKEFKKRVVDSFLIGHKKGITPNPCVVCNKEIKFGLLMEKVLKLGADYLATGHYARSLLQRREREFSIFNFQFSKYKLFRGKDREKDQSYFLWQLNQGQLKHILFPVGNYTKTQVRKIAKKFNLPTFNIPESQEICFIQDRVKDFLNRHLKVKPGLILTTEGKEIGEHQGLPFYTIGQRKGIGLSDGPFYVVDKDFKKNNLIVGQFFNNKALCSKSLIAKNVNWVSGQENKFPLKIRAQIRYGHKAVPALITKQLKSQTYALTFTNPQRAITPGQSVVFYHNQELLGGGIIGADN